MRQQLPLRTVVLMLADAFLMTCTLASVCHCQYVGRVKSSHLLRILVLPTENSYLLGRLRYKSYERPAGYTGYDETQQDQPSPIIVAAVGNHSSKSSSMKINSQLFIKKPKHNKLNNLTGEKWIRWHHS